MTPDMVLDLGERAMEVTTILLALVLLPTLVVGLVVAMFQAVTQINEMTLTFIPKLIVLGIVMVMIGPWMLEFFMDFTIDLIRSIPELLQ